jgi:pimeloyl-ACP methyl ester carboxylesterase
MRKIFSIALIAWPIIALLAVMNTSAGGSKLDSYVLFEKPGRLIPVGDKKLSMYCVGMGGPTVILETGFGGGTYYAWHQLQPVLARTTRTCSYDRAGYGFSTLGSGFPRDVDHFVTDLHDMLTASGEPGPYVLVGHSNGGLIIGAFADRYHDAVRGLVFLDAAVQLPGQEPPKFDVLEEQQASLNEHLASIRRCLVRAEAVRGPIVPKSKDECVSTEQLAPLPRVMSRVLVRELSNPAHWKSYLSEAECNYSAVKCVRPSLRREAWTDIPVRVVIVSLSQLDDVEAAKVFGLSASDHEAIAAARQGRAGFENRQAQICEFVLKCKVERIPTTNHYVQNAAPSRVAQVILGLVSKEKVTQ